MDIEKKVWQEVSEEVWLEVWREVRREIGLEVRQELEEYFIELLLNNVEVIDDDASKTD